MLRITSELQEDVLRVFLAVETVPHFLASLADCLLAYPGATPKRVGLLLWLFCG